MQDYKDLIDQSYLTVPSFTLECGAELKQVPVAYKTWGTLSETKDNVMIICHAFTGSADVEDWYAAYRSERAIDPDYLSL
jgi:homoserine O-acetyltransferase/O-succinyltransferase